MDGFEDNDLEALAPIIQWSTKKLADEMATDRPHVCSRCGKTYKYDNNLRRHLKDECGQLPRFKCQFCDYRSKQKSNMKRHVDTHHGPTAPPPPPLLHSTRRQRSK